MRKRIELIGELACDSGTLVITDPQYLPAFVHDTPSGSNRYLHREPADEDLPYSFDGAHSAAHSKFGVGMLQKWMGTAVEAGEPDVYPVFAEYNSIGQLERVFIRFRAEEEPQEWVPDAEVVYAPGEEPEPEPTRTTMLDRIRRIGDFQ